MALTNGAKKFLGLIATVAVVGGGIYGYKQYAATHPSQPAEVAVQAEQAAPVPQPIESPVAQAKQAEQAMGTLEREDAPVQEAPAPTQSASSNRGLANVLNAAKNK